MDLATTAVFTGNAHPELAQDIARCQFWALGIPDPRTPAVTKIDQQGRLVQLRQNDWVVDISRYREGAGQEMPRVLTATNPNTRVRMAIDKWLFFER